MQFQCRISQNIRHAILAELRANGPQNHPLWLKTVNDKPADHHVIADLHQGASTDIAQDGIALWAQVVYLSESNAHRVVYATYNRRVIACRQICYDRRFPCVGRSMAAIPDIAYLVAGDNPADYRMQPAIIRGDQSSRAVI